MIIITNLLQRKRLKKLGREGGGGEGEENTPSCTFVKEEIPQEEQQPGPSRKFNNLAESLNDVSNNVEKDDGTTCKICMIS